MQVTFQVTGPTREAVKGAADRQLAAFDGSAVWQLEVDVTPAFRLDAPSGFDWCGEVHAWDGEDTPPPRLTLVDDEEG